MWKSNVPQDEEEEDGGEYDGDDVGDVCPGVEEDTGAGGQIVVLVTRGTGVPGVRSAVTGAGGWLPAAPPGQAVRAVVLVVANTGAGGEVVVLQAGHTATLLLSTTATLTLSTGLHLHLPAHRLVFPRPPPRHRHHHLHHHITPLCTPVN